MRHFSVVLVLALLLQSCCWVGLCEDPPPSETSDIPEFNSTPKISNLSVSHLDEVSGIVPSYRLPNHLWLMEDSGNESKIDLIKNDGSYIKKVTFAGNNRDWEDIAIGPGPVSGKNYIYIGEIGDNQAVYGNYYIYRFEEPEQNQDRINNYETIHFRYPNNASYDAETLLLDPLTKDLYVITKQNSLNVSVFKLPYPQSTTSVNIPEFLGTIPYFMLVAGDISPKGDEILIKSYEFVLYWKIRPGETIYQTLKRDYDLYAPYIMEPQGEAVCWDLEAKGYYTISEKGGRSQTPPLYYYSKK